MISWSIREWRNIQFDTHICFNDNHYGCFRATQTSKSKHQQPSSEQKETKVNATKKWVISKSASQPDLNKVGWGTWWQVISFIVFSVPLSTCLFPFPSPLSLLKPNQSSDILGTFQSNVDNNHRWELVEGRVWKHTRAQVDQMSNASYSSKHKYKYNLKIPRYFFENLSMSTRKTLKVNSSKLK